MSEESRATAQTHMSEDWSHVRETINMLYLAICQIEATLGDSNKSVETLTQTFTALASHTQSVSEQVQNLTEPQQLDEFKDDIRETAKELQTNIGQSVQAFQFYDRVCQRLDHVSNSLEKVSTLLEQEEQITNPNSWREVQYSIKSSYTMEAEHIMFEFIMRGGKVKDALEIYKHHFVDTPGSTDQDNDEIELF